MKKEKEERILNKRINNYKEKALSALETAREIENNKLKDGYRYIKIDKQTSKLIK